MRLLGLDRPLPAAIATAQTRAIDAGHCNALPAAMLPAMARAQIARDAFMALKIHEHRARGALLLAGNGHVRRDIGVPRWLPAASDVHVVGYLETADDEGSRYDRTVVTARAARADPCEALLKSRAAKPAR